MIDTTPERHRAADIQQRYATVTKVIRDDADLTDEARRRRLSEEWVKARAELDRLQATERARLASREHDLERRLFGSATTDGAQAISARDAQDRAAKLVTPAEAADALALAERNGDQALARAIAHHAVQMSRTHLSRQSADGWDGVTAAFLTARPHLAEVVEELAQIERLTTRQVLHSFSLAQPVGVLPADINAARGAEGRSLQVSRG